MPKVQYQSSLFFFSMYTVNIACDLLEELFIAVAAVVRLWQPFCKHLIVSSVLVTVISRRPGICTHKSLYQNCYFITVESIKIDLFCFTPSIDTYFNTELTTDTVLDKQADWNKERNADLALGRIQIKIHMYTLMCLIWTYQIVRSALPTKVWRHVTCKADSLILWSFDWV